MNEQKFWPCEHIKMHDGEWCDAFDVRFKMTDYSMYCGICGARRPEPAGEEFDCETCEGTGVYLVKESDKTGKICPTCHGSGRKPVVNTIKVMRNGRPATQEELEAAVLGEPLPKDHIVEADKREPPNSELVVCDAATPECKMDGCAHAVAHVKNEECIHSECFGDQADCLPVTAPKEETTSMVPLGPEECRWVSVKDRWPEKAHLFFVLDEEGHMAVMRWNEIRDGKPVWLENSALWKERFPTYWLENVPPVPTEQENK